MAVFVSNIQAPKDIDDLVYYYEQYGIIRTLMLF